MPNPDLNQILKSLDEVVIAQHVGLVCEKHTDGAEPNSSQKQVRTLRAAASLARTTSPRAVRTRATNLDSPEND